MNGMEMLVSAICKMAGINLGDLQGAAINLQRKYEDAERRLARMERNIEILAAAAIRANPELGAQFGEAVERAPESGDPGDPLRIAGRP